MGEKVAGFVTNFRSDATKSGLFSYEAGSRHQSDVGSFELMMSFRDVRARQKNKSIFKNRRLIPLGER
jgi:hypothetical protein